MSNHKTALVPLATSEFQTPELYSKGFKADTGLFAESLIYYDTVYVHAGNSEQFAGFISLLIQQGLSYEQLIELIEEGTLKFFTTVSAHPFMGAGRPDIITSFYAIEEDAIKNPNYFETNFLETVHLRDSFSNLSYLNKKEYDKFCKVAKKNSLVFDNEVISSGLVNNAYEDFLNPEKHKLIVRAMLSETYKINGLGEVPDFNVRIREMNSKNMEEIAKNLKSTVVGRNFDNGEYKIYEVYCELPVKGLKNSEQIIQSFRTFPLSCSGVASLYIRSAGRLKCDFFLPNPISQIIGNKLYEISDSDVSRNNVKNQNLINRLEHLVNFPDLHLLVNSNHIDFVKILEIRKEGKKFRDWLQETDAEHDIQIFWAYHNEVAKITGFTKNARKSIKIFGVIASGIASGGIGLAANHFSQNEYLGAAATAISFKVADRFITKGTEKLFDYSAELGSNWKPVCFGDWTKNEISLLIKKQNKKQNLP